MKRMEKSTQEMLSKMTLANSRAPIMPPAPQGSETLRAPQKSSLQASATKKAASAKPSEPAKEEVFSEPNINRRPVGDGKFSYTVQIRRRIDGKQHSLSKTFTRLPAAKSWRNKNLREIEERGFPLHVIAKTTIADVINDRLQRGAKLARTAEHNLKFIANHEFGQTKVGTLNQQQLYDFADLLSSEERSPQTVAGYMSHLARTLNWANDRGTVIPVEAVAIAMRTMWEDEVLARSEQRDRRPEVWELDRILTAIFENKRQKIPVGHILVFALFSARRISEICNLRWEDFREEEAKILVREMKHPRQKKRNNVWCDLPPEAMAIIRVMPRISEFIFPFDPRSVGAAFRRHREKVGVVDLRFHDLRHEAISRLSEMGNQAEFVAKTSGHKGASCLERYTHVMKVGDKYEGWSWLTFVCDTLNLPETEVLESVVRKGARNK